MAKVEADTTRKPRFGFDIQGLVANIAAAAQPLVTVPDSAGTAKPAAAQDQTAAPEPPPWRPPGIVASADQTTAAMREASGRLAGLIQRRRQNAPEPDAAAVVADLAAVARHQGVRAPALGRPDQVLGALPPPPANPENLPANIVRDLTDYTGIHPTWHSAKNLPGYTGGGKMRLIIRAAFATATAADVEQVHMICELLNPPEHVSAVATWVAGHAERQDAIHRDFDQSVEGFSADFLVYKDATTTYLVTQDVGGRYVYVCPGGLGRPPVVAAPEGQGARRIQAPGMQG